MSYLPNVGTEADNRKLMGAGMHSGDDQLHQSHCLVEHLLPLLFLMNIHTDYFCEFQ